MTLSIPDEAVSNVIRQRVVLFMRITELCTCFRDAETLFKKSLAMRESLFGGKDLVVAQSLDRLAALYYNWKM